MDKLLDTLKPNDILVEMFGYNMTLFSFYKVVARKNKTVKLVELDRNVVATKGFMQFQVKPVNKTSYLTRDIITKRFNKYGNICIDNKILFRYNPSAEYIEYHAD